MRDVDEISVLEVACLSGGHWAATRTALAMLHTRGAVVHNGGQVHRRAALPTGAEPFERTLYATLYGSVAARELVNHRRIRHGLDELRRALVVRGLVRPSWRRIIVPTVLLVLPSVVLARLAERGVLEVSTGLGVMIGLVAAAAWFLPRRTLAGARTLRVLRRRRPLRTFPPDTSPTPEETGFAVGLYGDAGLLATVPRFARAGGLLDRGRRSLYHGDGRLDVTAGSATDL